MTATIRKQPGKRFRRCFRDCVPKKSRKPLQQNLTAKPTYPQYLPGGNNNSSLCNRLLFFHINAKSRYSAVCKRISGAFVFFLSYSYRHRKMVLSFCTKHIFKIMLDIMSNVGCFKIALKFKSMRKQETENAHAANSSPFLPQKSFKQKCKEIRKSIEFTVPADIIAAKFYTVHYIAVFFTGYQIVKRGGRTVGGFDLYGYKRTGVSYEKVHFYCGFSVAVKIQGILIRFFRSHVRLSQ